MATVYTYKGLQVFLDSYFIPNERKLKAIGKLLAKHYPADGSGLPFDASDHPSDPIFIIACDSVVDGWDIVRKFYVRLPSLAVAEEIADLMGGYISAGDGLTADELNSLQTKYDSLEEFILITDTLGQ